MNPVAAHFPADWLALGWLLAGLGLVYAAWHVPWLALRQSQLTAWFGATVAILALWQLKAEVHPGLAFHLLGTSALTLIAGPHAAKLGMAVVLAAEAAQGHGDWASLGLAWLLVGLLPSWLTCCLLTWAQRHLPANYFVYIFFNCFAAAALSMWAVGLASCLLLTMAGAYATDFLFTEQLPYYFLMGWPEAFTTGIHLTLLVVYRPEWVATFDDRFYLARK